MQVEHPVTEGITETNIPSIQLMVGMGIPLWRMPELRTSFDQDPKGDNYFDLETTPQRLPQHHVVAVRITSENAGDGFKPTAGRVDEVSRGANELQYAFLQVMLGWVTARQLIIEK
jgi:acetyl-CoA carboxylase/biotin carboxylase 1